jgi:hypothetical protein
MSVRPSRGKENRQFCLFSGQNRKKEKGVRAHLLVLQGEKLRSMKIQQSDLQFVFRNVIIALGSTFLPIVLRQNTKLMIL